MNKGVIQVKDDLKALMQVLMKFSRSQPRAERPKSFQEPQADLKGPSNDHEDEADPVVVDPNDIHDYVFHEECDHPIALATDLLPAFLPLSLGSSSQTEQAGATSFDASRDLAF